MQQSILEHWVRFCSTLQQVANDTMPPEQLQCFLSGIPNPQTMDAALTVNALQSFFCVPMNSTAVNNLNVQGFTGEVNLCNDVVVDFGKLMGAFQGTGPSAQVWYPFLALAESCNPMAIRADPARQHLQQYLPNYNASLVCTPSNSQFPSMAPKTGLDGILTNVVAALPKIQDTLSKVLSTTRDEPTNINTIIDHVQDSLLKPLLEGMGNNEQVEPVVKGILDGFRNLGQVMNNNATVDNNVPDSSMKD